MAKNINLKKAINITLSVLLSLIILLIMIFTIYAFNSKKNDGIPKIFGKSYLTVVSNSMNTTNEEYNFKGFKRGDMIVIERYQWVEASNMRFEVGDIITFRDVDENNNYFYNTHRIIKVNNDHYVTQGDVANKLGYSQDPDGQHAEKVYFHEVVGSYQKTIRNVGFIFIFLQSTIGFLIIIVIPLIALFILEIFNFRKAYKEYKQERGTKAMSTEDIQKEIERLKQQLDGKKEA